MSNQEVSKAVRFKRTYRGDNLYVIAVYDESGAITEILLSQSVGGHENACTTSGLEFVAALVNELISRGEIERVGALAAISSLGSRTLPGIISQIIREHSQLPEVVA